MIQLTSNLILRSRVARAVPYVSTVLVILKHLHSRSEKRLFPDITDFRDAAFRRRYR